MYLKTGLPMPSHYSRLFYTKVIEVYKNNPCLWDFDDPDYKNKFVRHEAWKKVLAAAQSEYPDYTIEQLVNKIANMRGSYRKLLQRVKKAKEAGKDFEPQLCYFNLLGFLKYNERISLQEDKSENEEESEYSNDQECTVLEDTANDSNQTSSNSMNTSPAPPENSIEPEWSQLMDDFTKVKEQVDEIRVLEEKGTGLVNSTNTSCTPKKKSKQTPKWAHLLDELTKVKQQLNETCVSEKIEPCLPQISSACSIKNGLESTCASSTPQESRKRARTEMAPPSKSDDILEKLTKLIENSSETPVHNKDKERTYDSFGDYVAGKLRYIPPEMVPMCQKLINDAIFYGETKTLNMTSRIVTDH